MILESSYIFSDFGLIISVAIVATVADLLFNMFAQAMFDFLDEITHADCDA
jgi:hypothetical protein